MGVEFTADKAAWQFTMAKSPVSPATLARVEALLGRAPRGLEAVAVSRPDGEPVVLQVASLVDGKPFPTLFWLGLFLFFGPYCI